MDLVPFLPFKKYNSIHPPIGRTHPTPYFIICMHQLNWPILQILSSLPDLTYITWDFCTLQN